jgi:hypothetical protein
VLLSETRRDIDAVNVMEIKLRWPGYATPPRTRFDKLCDYSVQTDTRLQLKTCSLVHVYQIIVVSAPMLLYMYDMICMR